MLVSLSHAVSTHASVRRRQHWGMIPEEVTDVSTHASVRRRLRTVPCMLWSSGFNSRLREEATRPLAGSLGSSCRFNSRLREEATRDDLHAMEQIVQFQLTPP